MRAHATSPRIEQRRTRVIAAALSAFAPAVGLACGACAEDKIASTYDHGVAVQAAASGDVVVFCEVAGPLDAQRLMQAVRRVRGVKPQSVRVSTQPAALSFALDPRAHSPQAAVDAVQRGLVAGTTLIIVRPRQPVAPLP